MTKKVKNVQKKYSRTEFADKIRKSQERLVVSLAAAWEAAPDDPDIREQLMKATEKAINLREKVYKEILDEEPPDVKDSYNKLRKKLEEEIRSESK